MIYFSWVTSLNGYIHFRYKGKQVLWGLREKGEGGGGYFQFTELGGARCVEDSERHKPEMQCYIYPADTPLPSPTPANKWNLSMYVAFETSISKELFTILGEACSSILKNLDKVWETAGQLLRKSAKSTEERVRSPIFVSASFLIGGAKYPAVTPQKEKLFQEGEQSLHWCTARCASQKRGGQLGRGDLPSPGLC